MDKDLDRRALGVLDDVLEVAPGERDAWLDTRCGGDPALKARVSRLLDRSGQHAFQTGTAARLAADEATPDRIGAYRITGLIGRGGMGAVYRGARDLGDFDHVAAIKLIRPGALSDTLVERFRRERQTLARLAHPHIARLFDGGETGDGLPYLVMECVDGQPLHHWLAEDAPALPARLALFVKVCRAVGYAHQNLVIHRDLTPANILVEANGEPKLIDFGIARPLGGEQATAPAETATPGFAAPERLQGAPASTLTDIYALGRLLELLAGEGATQELLAIVRRASAPEPELRYPTADALADDVERHQQGQPVRAMGGGRGYVLAKFVRRNRAGVLVATAALAFVIGALVVSLLALADAQRARSSESARFAQLRSLSGYMLFTLNNKLRRVPGNVGPRSSLAAQAQRYLSGLSGSSDATPQLRLEIVDGLIELARVQGSPTEPNLGEARLAQLNLERAERELAALQRETGPTPAIRSRLARLRAYLALIQVHGLKDVKGSDASLAAARRALASVAAEARDMAWHDSRRLVRRASLEFYDLEERLPDLERERRGLLEDMAEWPPSLRRSPAAAIDRGHAEYYAGIIGLVRETGDQGARSFQGALAHYEEAYRRDALPSTLYLMGWSAFLGFEAASAIGDTDRASRLVARARAIAGRLRALDDKDDASYVLARNAQEAYAKDLAAHGRFGEALAVHQASLDETRARLTRFGGTGVDLAYSEMVMGELARQAGDTALACRSWTSAERRFANVERQGKLLGVFNGYRPKLRQNLARCGRGAPARAFVRLG